jgi:hypothetical protein
MNYKELKHWASTCELAADEMAIRLINQQELLSVISVFQSKCNFNLYWLYQISPEVILHYKTLLFLAENIKKFTRKIEIRELLNYDSLIYHNDIDTFEDFKDILNIF